MATYKSPKPAPKQAVLPAEDNKAYLRSVNMSVANSHSNDYPGVKTDGIKIRGTGAATKGTIARGPMG